jgi:uncharacterized protein YacL
MIDFVPDAKQLSDIFSQAIAPTFFLGAIAGFVSLMASRLSAVIERVRILNAIGEEDDARAHLKGDLERLKRRARYLNSGIVAALHGGLCATLLLAILFISALFKLEHAYGAPLMFVFATFFLGFALLRFAQEARIGLVAADEYQ